MAMVKCPGCDSFVNFSEAERCKRLIRDGSPQLKVENEDLRVALTQAQTKIKKLEADLKAKAK